MSLNYGVLSGKQFNKMYKNTNFYKFLRKSQTHRKFLYKEGENIDTSIVNDESKKGLHFYKESKCYKFWKKYGQAKVAFVKIPDDAIVYKECNRFRANKIIITEIKSFNKMPDKFWQNIVPKDGMALIHVKNQTEEMCIDAVYQNKRALQYVKGLSSASLNNVHTFAVNQSGIAIKWIKNPSIELCVLAVKQDGLALGFIDNQTEDICMLAIKQNISAYHYVKEHNVAICEFTIQQDGLMLEFVKEQYQTEKVCELAVTQNGWALRHVKKQTPKICELAVKNKPYALQYVQDEFKTKKLCISAVQLNGNVLQFINNQSDEMCELAVKECYFAIRFVNNQTDEICKLAVQQSGLMLQFVREQTEEICELAIKQNFFASRYVKIPPNPDFTFGKIDEKSNNEQRNNFGFSADNSPYKFTFGGPYKTDTDIFAPKPSVNNTPQFKFGSVLYNESPSFKPLSFVPTSTINYPNIISSQLHPFTFK